MVETLIKLKKACSVLVVSHDLKELEPLIDASWKMENGSLKPLRPP